MDSRESTGRRSCRGRRRARWNSRVSRRARPERPPASVSARPEVATIMNAPVESNPPSLGPKSADTLEANLAALGSVNHVALAAIRAAEEREIEIETAEDGRLTGTWNGRRLASARRPAAETTRLVEEVD